MELIPLHRIFRYALFILLLSVSSCTTSTWQQSTRSGNDEAQFMADISYLADDRLEGRAFGTKGEYEAGYYIAKRFKLLDLQPKGEKGTWFQSFTVKNPTPHGVEFSPETERGSLTGRNVVGYMDHGAPYTI